MVRLIVGSLSTDAGLSFERGQDLRLAVTEGVTAAMEGADPGATVRLWMREAQGVFEVGIGSDSLALETISGRGIRRPLIEALCDEVSVSCPDGRSELRLSIRPAGTGSKPEREPGEAPGPPVTSFAPGAPASPKGTGWSGVRPTNLDDGAAAAVIPGERVRLELPATPESVAVARLAASAMASRMGFSVDEVEDLRIAVSELCAALYAREGPAASEGPAGGGGGGGRLELEYAAGLGALEVTGRGGEPPGRLSALSEQILSCLADAYETGASPDGRGLFRLTKRGGST